MDKELSPEHERFCFLYSRYLNATKAYLQVYPDAGYNSARSSASDLLAKPNIKERIGILCAERDTELGVTEADIKRDLARLKNYNIQDFYNGDQLKPINELDPDLAYAIESIEYESIASKDGSSVGMTTKIKLTNKKGPLELLGKTLKMWKDVGSADNPASVVHKIERVVVKPK